MHACKKKSVFAKVLSIWFVIVLRRSDGTVLSNCWYSCICRRSCFISSAMWCVCVYGARVPECVRGCNAGAKRPIFGRIPPYLYLALQQLINTSKLPLELLLAYHVYVHVILGEGSTWNRQSTTFWTQNTSRCTIGLACNQYNHSHLNAHTHALHHTTQHTNAGTDLATSTSLSIKIVSSTSRSSRNYTVAKALWASASWYQIGLRNSITTTTSHH